MQEKSKLLRTFFYKGNRVRTVEHKGETWWIGTDVCKVLEITNASLAINGNDNTGDMGLDEDEKDYIMIHNVVGIKQATLCVNEPGLYHLISKSRTPEAKTFGRWIRHEVLPAIRKTGSYSLPQQDPAEPQQQLLQEARLQMCLLSLSKDELDDELNRLRTMLAAVETVNYKYSQLPLSKDALRCELHYLCALLAAVEAVYNYKYPQAHNSAYPREEQKTHQVETLVLLPGETKPNLQTILLDYIHKTGSVTVRYLQQSGPRSLRNLPADQLRTMLQALVTDGVLTIVQVGKAEHYRLP